MRALNHLPHEARVLLAAAPPVAVTGGIWDAAARISLGEGRVRWPALFWMMGHEQAARPVARWLGRVAEEGLRVPDEVLTTAHRMAMVEEFRSLAVRSALDGALEVLAREEVPVVLLKGSALAGSYPHFADRPMKDLDLLTAAEDGERGWTALRRAGWGEGGYGDLGAFFRRHHHMAPLFSPGRQPIRLELHRELLPRGAPFPLEGATVLSRSLPGPPGSSARLPSPTDALLHAALHLAWSHMFLLGAWRTLRDVAVLASSVDWADAIDEAERIRGTTALYWTLWLARELVEAEIPETVLEELAPPLPAALRRVAARHVLATLFHFSDARCPFARVERMVWELAILPGRSGHGDARPWLIDEGGALEGPDAAGWAERDPEAPGVELPRASRRQRLAGLARYTAALLGRAPSQRGA